MAREPAADAVAPTAARQQPPDRPPSVGPAQGESSGVIRVTPGVFEGDLRDLPLSRPWQPGDPVIEIPRLTTPTRRDAGATRGGEGSRLPAGAGELLQEPAGSSAPDDAPPPPGEPRFPGELPDEVMPLAFSPPELDFAGSGFTGVVPPDPVGEVGPDHYIQMVNASGGSQVLVFDKTGAVVAGPFDLDSMWTAGGPCSTGRGDPIVIHDAVADRWLLTEFAFPANLCVYVSQTSDPVSGGFFLYDFTTPSFPDYPKYAVWPQEGPGGVPAGSYLVSSNEGVAAAYALERGAMLAGTPAGLVRRAAPALPGFGFNVLTPADLDGPIVQPPGSPAIFLRHRDDELHGPAMAGQDQLELWELDVDWSAPAAATFTGPTRVATAEFDSAFCGGAFNCLPQPLVAQRIDAIREPIMWRLVYRSFGSHETLLGSFVSDLNPATGAAIHAGVRWFELRRSPPGVGAWTVFQEGTHAPDADNRWVSSIAMDGCGNIALGYTVGSATTFPGIRYVGRQSLDPLGTMTTGEVQLIWGNGSQTSNRYGDYSSMNLDEADQCTFWYTNEFLPDVPSATTAEWETRIGSFSFDSCGFQPPGSEVPNTSVRVEKSGVSGVRIEWAAVTNANEYAVYRGTIPELGTLATRPVPYDHAASLAAGAGECDVGASFFVDADDQQDPTTFYYLVTARSCLVEGAIGVDSFGAARPDGSGCP